MNSEVYDIQVEILRTMKYTYYSVVEITKELFDIRDLKGMSNQYFNII